MIFNTYNTSIDDLHIDTLPQEVQDQFYDLLNNVPYIRDNVDINKPRACDLHRDDEGKIIIDYTKPHILEDMDYFRQANIHFQKTGRYTDLRPNANPNSEYGKWAKEEIRRCFEGMVRPSDGEWITGDYYFFLNYCPMQITRKSNGRTERLMGFPSIWDGHYYKFHYLNIARNNGKHAAELASRSKGKSFVAAAMLAKRFILGESLENNKRVTSYIIAHDKAKLVAGDQTLDKFQYDIDFIAENTQFPRRRLKNSISEMLWTMGFYDMNSGTNKGSLNSVVGKPLNDASKLRGSRGVLYLAEEAGSFSNLLEVYNNLRPSVEEGDNVFGQLFLYGTSGDDESDFYALQEIMYNTQGYNVQGNVNVYDKEGQGRNTFAYFFPGYMNMAGCYDENGNSDVTKALVKILMDRFEVKYHSTDLSTITKRIAEIPITPQEAILRVRHNLFPVTDINERINQIINDPDSLGDVYTGDLTFNGTEVVYVPTANKPIREFPIKTDNTEGAIEFFSMPKKDSSGSVPGNRYICAVDPIDDDNYGADRSLYSTFVLDLWTDTIVAEYTGRKKFADDCFEITRKLCLFYHATCLYENNKKGMYAYFSRLNCSYLLAETPQYLRDKELIKGATYGNRAIGVNATLAINNYANKLIQQWLIQPVSVEKLVDGEYAQVEIPRLFTVKNLAFLKELALYNPDINVDRIRAFGIMMLYREQFMINYQGNLDRSSEVHYDYLGNDDFFTRNYDTRKALKSLK